MKYAIDLDLSKQQLLNAVVQNLNTPPTDPIDGQIYYNTSTEDEGLYCWVNGEWIELSNIYQHPNFTSLNPTLSGANVLGSFETNSEGHVIQASSRLLTLEDLGYEGDTDANNYIHPTFSNNDLGNALTGVEVVSDANVNSEGHVTGFSTRELTETDLAAVVFNDSLISQTTTWSSSKINSELDSRDTENRKRENHTGTQLSSTISDFTNAVKGSETTTEITLVNDTITYTDEDGVPHNLDLTPYLDNKNLPRLVSASLDSSTSIVTLVRDDNTTFDLDLTALDTIVEDLNTTTLNKKNIASVDGTNITETVTKINPATLTGNTLEIRYVNEAAVEQITSVDLSDLNLTDNSISNAEYDASTNIITLTEDDGTTHDIDLSEFSIIVNTDVNGVTTLTQEGVIKATLSRVGQTGDFNHLLNIPATFPASPHTLDSHSNVSIVSKTSGELLKWDGFNWVNNTLAEAGIEAAFTKNTGFNKDFGAEADTVAEGNDSRILNGQTAFDWGDHDGLYDNYEGWTLFTNGANRGSITSGENVNFVEGTNVSLGYSSTNNTITVNSTNTFLTDLSFNTGNGILTATLNNSSTITEDLDGRYALDSSIGNGTLTFNTSGIATGASSFSANQSSNSTFTVDVPGTNLTMGGSGNNRTVNSSTGNNVSIPIASTTDAGFLSTGDKDKLDGIEVNNDTITIDTLNPLTGGGSFTLNQNNNQTIQIIHPTFDGDDISINTGKKSGATVISNLEVNVTTNTDGHVTDASGFVDTRELTTSDIGAEPAFSKNSAFNKKFGTTAGTVAEGNDSRIDNGQTAFGWGDHSTEGYLTSYTETDPTVPNHVKNITTTEKSNWNTAYGWGNHVGRYMTEGQTKLDINTISNGGNRYDPSVNSPTNEHYAVLTYGNGGNVTGQLATHYQTGNLYSRGFNSTWSAWRRYWNDTDFTSTSISNWNTAYGWGDHDGLYVPKSGGEFSNTVNFVEGITIDSRSKGTQADIVMGQNVNISTAGTSTTMTFLTEKNSGISNGGGLYNWGYGSTVQDGSETYIMTLSNTGVLKLNNDTVYHEGNLRSNTQNDSRYVEVAGDTMSGRLEMGNILDMNNNDIVGVDQIRHRGDTDTYMQFHAADQWRVVTGGIERLEVNNSKTTVKNTLIADGNVGIGTTSPSEKLEVNGNIRATSDILANNNLKMSGDIEWTNGEITSDDNNTGARIIARAINNPPDGDAIFAVESSGGATRFGVTQNYGAWLRDSLRIGYSYDTGDLPVESNTLDVNGGIDANTLNTGQGDNELYAMNQNVRTTDSPTFAGLNLGNGNLNTVENIYLDNAILSQGDTNTYMQFHASDQWRVVTGGGERLEVNSSKTTVKNTLIADGNVGIGTASPSVDSNTKTITIAGDAGQVNAPQDGTESIPTLRIEDTLPNYGSNTATPGEYRGQIEFYSNESSGNYPGVSAAIRSINENTYNSALGLGFFTNIASDGNVERMRINNAGKVGIGTTSPSEKLEVNGNIRIGNNDLIKAGNTWIRNNGSVAVLSNQGTGAMLFRPNGDSSGSGEMKLEQNGDLSTTGDVIAFSSSDKNLKENIVNIDSPVDKLKQLNGVYFNWIESDDRHNYKGKDIGVIAQEVESILPEIVTTRENGVKAVQYHKLIPLTIEVIKEQDKKIEKQQTQLDSLQEQINELKKLMK